MKINFIKLLKLKKMSQVLIGFIFFFNQVLFGETDVTLDLLSKKIILPSDTLRVPYQFNKIIDSPSQSSSDKYDSPIDPKFPSMATESSTNPNNENNSMFLVNFKGGKLYHYKRTEKLYKTFTTKGENHMNASCSKNEGDMALTLGANMTSSDSSGHSQANTTANQSAQSLAQGLAFKGKCEVENAELLAEGETVKKMLNQEKTSCEIAGQADAITGCQKICIRDTNGTCKPPCVTSDSKLNKAQCDKVALEITQKDSWFMGLLKNHWVEMLAILGLAGAGLMALNSSSDKQKQDFQTNPLASATPTPTIQPATPTQTQTEATPVVTPIVQTTTDFQSAFNQPYCKTANQPLECLVTPGCDLKCVADKYGVSNYGGMDKDTTRIGRDGRPVDGASAATGNPGGANTAGGGGSSASTKGGDVANLSPSSETGATNSLSTRHGSSTNYGDDDSMGGGRGGYDGGSSGSDRDPANDRYKAVGNSGSNATNANPATTGPILPLSSNLFERITNVARTQCVRELLLCNEK